MAVAADLLPKRAMGRTVAVAARRETATGRERAAKAIWGGGEVCGGCVSLSVRMRVLSPRSRGTATRVHRP